MVVVDFGSHCPTKVIRNLARVLVEKKGITKTSIIHLKTSTLPLTHRRGKASDFQQITNHRRKKKRTTVYHTPQLLSFSLKLLSLCLRNLSMFSMYKYTIHTLHSLSHFSLLLPLSTAADISKKVKASTIKALLRFFIIDN